MNVQDAKNLTIPEGSVKMIHDKDNRLLWGAVGYNTKYAGDTTQKTTTGKNLYNATKAETTTNSLVWSADTSEISLNGHITSSANLNLPNVSLKAGTYVCSLEVVSGTISSTSTGLNTYFSGTNVSRTPSSFNLTNASPRNTFVITVSADTTDARLFFYARTSEIFSNVKVKYQIVAGSTADYSFEPYTNGPAPNPDYPQDIDVVTGEQTVTISDGVDSEDFTISLGSIELCKIGTYQDYIYKSSDDWYVHKYIGYTDLATQTWGGANSQLKPTTTITDIKYVSSNQEVGAGLAEKYIVRKASGMSTAVGYIAIDTSAVRVNTGDASITPTGLFYYALATPTDTKITDATLVGQLNAIHEWMTRYGYNSVVTGNLPIIIDKTNL